MPDSGLAACSFPKSVRLRKRKEFLRLSDSACTYKVKGFLVVWKPNGGENPRVGITVSKKIGCAVIRNRIKRMVREVFRRDRFSLPNVDVNVIARREAAVMEPLNAANELKKAFRHIGTPSCSRASRSL